MQYRREVDGLRALALLPVILFHAGIPAFSGGFVGVDVFFVISGYLITSIIAAGLDTGTFSILEFYERRARRILPALVLLVLVCLPCAWLWLLPEDLKEFSQSVVAVSLFVSNVQFWRESGYFDTAAELKPLLHTWSLSVEEQFYVLFPVLLMFLWRRGRRKVPVVLASIGLASLAGAQWGAFREPSATFYLLPTRAWELILGSLVYFYLTRAGRHPMSRRAAEAGGVAGLALVLYAVLTFSKTTPFPSIYALAPTVGASLILVCATPMTFVGRVLCSRAFAGIGLISYSGYLWHYPVVAFARHGMLSAPREAYLLLLSMASLVPAYLSWRFVERPFRDRQWISRASVFRLGVLASAVCVAIGFYGHRTGGLRTRFDDGLLRILDLASSSSSAGAGCWAKLTADPRVENSCVFGNPPDNIKFALLGDSHAGSFVEAVERFSAERGVAGRNITYTGCPPLAESRSSKAGASQEACRALRENLFGSLETTVIPASLIVVARWTVTIEQTRFDNREGGVELGDEVTRWTSEATDSLGYRAALIADYTKSIRALLSGGRQVILVYPIPEMGWNVPDRLVRLYRSKGAIDQADASTDHALFKERNAAATAMLDGIGDHPNLMRVFPDRIICSTYVADRCVAHVNGIPLYRDDNHLSDAGAALVLDEVFRVLADNGAMHSTDAKHRNSGSRGTASAQLPSKSP